MLERFSQMPSALKAAARWERLGPSQIPVMLVHPRWESAAPAPIVLWMHGRTVSKEIDPGRYLRWMRSGIGVCAIDLPGHGERFDSELQDASRTYDVVQQMIREIDEIVQAVADRPEFDADRIGIGGMSAGGMATLARLCSPHSFRAGSVEATTGSWTHQRQRSMFRVRSEDEIRRLDPIARLDGWREIAFQAIHSRLDEWVSFEGQLQFIEALRSRYRDPGLIDFVVYDQTGAPNEHQGFGRMAADAKDRQAAFFRRWLLDAAAHDVSGNG